MADDLLAGAVWACCETAPGAVDHPAQLDAAAPSWIPASVPGTAAAARRAAGTWTTGDTHDFDAGDWWFRCRFSAGDADPQPWALLLDGLATVADVWLNDELVLHSETMFRRHRVEVPVLRTTNDLTIRCAALAPLLAVRRPRPRWRTRLVSHQTLRWYRTTFLGRMPGWSAGPAPVGPWRPVRLVPASTTDVVSRRLDARLEGSDGVLDVTLHLRGAVVPGAVTVVVGDEAPVELELAVGADGEVVATGRVVVADVQPWWPHTHGPPHLHPVAVDVDGERLPLGRVGFRAVEVDRTDGAFRLSVNGVDVFCRGGGWTPLDPVGLVTEPEDVAAAVAQARHAGLNMIRVLGTMVYEDASFWDACDEHGMLVWLDCMFANTDPPDDPGFTATVEAEVTGVLADLQGRPSLTVVCGGSEVEQQAAMVGVASGDRGTALFDRVIPAVVERWRPDVVYVPSSPTGGALPFQPDSGVAHYYGVGAYLRPVEDARRAGVRFASESLAFAVPPEPEAVDDWFGGSSAAGHRPDWKAGVPRDNGASWDFEDVRDHYVGDLFGVDPRLVRYGDPDRYLDLGRAAVAHLVESVVTEWRRPGSTCAGALTLLLRDLAPGAGWGFLDCEGRPKSAWWALRRASAPLAVLLTDEGLNGLHAHLVNDRPEPWSGTMVVELHDLDGRRTEATESAVMVEAHGGHTVSIDAAFDGFRDLNWAHRFGPRVHDSVSVALVDDQGVRRSEAVHLVGGLDRPTVTDVGLRATLVHDGGWAVELTTAGLAQFVSFQVAGWDVEDSWFHLAGGNRRRIGLLPRAGTRADVAPTGVARALNSRRRARIEPAHDDGSVVV